MHVDLQVDVHSAHEAVNRQVVVGDIVVGAGVPSFRVEDVEVAVVVCLHLSVVLEALLEARDVDLDRGGPRIERGRVGDQGPRAILIYAELHRRVLRSVVLHLLAWSAEVPALGFDPVFLSPEG